MLAESALKSIMMELRCAGAAQDCLEESQWTAIQPQVAFQILVELQGNQCAESAKLSACRNNSRVYPTVLMQPIVQTACMSAKCF